MTDRSIVCLHGLRRTPRDWDGVIGALPEGWTARAPALPADPDEAAAVADQVIGRGDVVFAHSMGAVSALRALRDRPRPLAGVVLTGSFFPPARNGRSRAATVGDYLAHRAAFLREALRASDGVEREPDGGGRRALTSLLRQATRPEDPAPAWQGRPLPVLVVHARDDHHVPVDFAIAAAARHPSWTLRRFDSGGHHLHVTRPEEWTRAVLAWVEARS